MSLWQDNKIWAKPGWFCWTGSNWRHGPFSLSFTVSLFSTKARCLQENTKYKQMKSLSGKIRRFFKMLICLNLLSQTSAISEFWHWNLIQTFDLSHNFDSKTFTFRKDGTRSWKVKSGMFKAAGLKSHSVKLKYRQSSLYTNLQL